MDLRRELDEVTYALLETQFLLNDYDNRNLQDQALLDEITANITELTYDNQRLYDLYTELHGSNNS